MSLRAPSGSRSRAARGPVAITGLGAVSALGLGAEAMWRGLAEGRDGIRPIERFSTTGFGVHTAGMVPSDALSSVGNTQEFALALALAAAREAVRGARLEVARVPPERVAIVFGTSLATHPEGIHRLAEITGDEAGARGPRITISTACSSSANAIGAGRDLLLEGIADVVIAGGADALTEEIFAGFHNLGLLAPEKCAPFSEPPGTTLGEGAGFLVLELLDHAARRGASPIAWVSGYGLSCDAHHATSPDPTGSGIARAARSALADAGLDPSEIDYVNAHGTGTEANDPAEWRGVSLALGDRARAVPVSSTKSVLGHGQGAAGALEIIATILAMRRGAIPQTLHHTRPRPRCPEDPVAQRTPRPHRVGHALCNSSAFGGANAIVTIDAADRPAPSRTAARRGVRILGASAVLPAGRDAKSLLRLSASETVVGRVEADPAPRSLAGVDLRGFDPMSLLLTFATADALRDAGLPVRGAKRDRAGLFAALARISPASAHELDSSVKERGLWRLSAPAFTRVVLNASSGACARALSLRGPTTTLTTGDGGGLTALVLAADHLALRDDADVICVVAADELARDESPERSCEAGACLVLGADVPSTVGVSRAKGEPFLRLAGWGLAGPGRLDEAIARAVTMADMDPRDAPPRDDGGPFVAAPAAHPLVRAAAIAARLRDEGPIFPGGGAALLAHESGSCSAAAILALDPPETS